MSAVGSFAVLARMCADNADIRLAPAENITLLRKVKAGTQVTIGVQGDVVGGIFAGELTAFLLVYSVKQFQETKTKMEAEAVQAVNE